MDIDGRKWDGSFCDSQYRETGNLVNDVFENNWRILHEPTTDGYTHEIVDRGDYLSEDYYFPRMEPGRKPHIHYEFRSNGEILIDGKPIAVKIPGGETKMRNEYRSGKYKGMDAHILKKESEDQLQEGNKLHELGVKFESDKAKLEKQIDQIQRSQLPDKQKKAMLSRLREAISALQEQYDREVTEEEARIEAELNEQTETMQETADELARQARELRDVRMEAASMDASSAADAAEEQKATFDRMKAENVEKLKAMMEKAAVQRKNIHAKMGTGR